jgi:hypothetical protein
MYHKALLQTPYEAWTDEKPPDHIHNFGALVTARKPGKRPAKTDLHTDHGALLGYGAIPKHVRYFDQTPNRENLSIHHIIDETHYGKTHRPPGHQIIMDTGYELPPLLPAIVTPPPLSQYLLPSLHNSFARFYSKLLPLPMHEFPISRLCW